MVKKKLVFHQENERVQTCVVSTAKFNEKFYELFPHPSYSLYLTRSDYFLLPNLASSMGTTLRNKRFVFFEKSVFNYKDREHIDPHLSYCYKMDKVTVTYFENFKEQYANMEKNPKNDTVCETKKAE